jgi:hypothetical protein
MGLCMRSLRRASWLPIILRLCTSKLLRTLQVYALERNEGQEGRKEPCSMLSVIHRQATYMSWHVLATSRGSLGRVMFQAHTSTDVKCHAATSSNAS